MTFIGAGFVSLELVTLVAAAGVDVTVIVHSDRVLREFPKKASATLVQAMQERGITFMFNTNTQTVQQGQTGLTVKTDQGSVATDYVVDATGRHPNIERLHLERTGIQFDRHGIQVDNHLMTTVNGVFAIGDVASRHEPKLTPVAEFEGQYLFDYLTGRTTELINYPKIGRAAFTYPVVAAAGVNPDEVADNPAYRIQRIPLKYGSLYAGQNDQVSELTLVFKGDQLVGASEVGEHAADDVNNFLPVIGLKINGEEYRRAVIAIYPALADKVAGAL